MDITLSIDDEVIQKARLQADALGTTVNQLIREYLENFVGKRDHNADAAEFERLMRIAHGSSQGWKFDREEIYEHLYERW